MDIQLHINRSSILFRDLCHICPVRVATDLWCYPPLSWVHADKIPSAVHFWGRDIFCASYSAAIKLNATTARAADISANLVIKYDVTKVLTKYLSFCLLRWNMRIVWSANREFIPQTRGRGEFSILVFEVTWKKVRALPPEIPTGSFLSPGLHTIFELFTLIQFKAPCAVYFSFKKPCHGTNCEAGHHNWMKYNTSCVMWRISGWHRTHGQSLGASSNWNDVFQIWLGFSEVGVDVRGRWLLASSNTSLACVRGRGNGGGRDDSSTHLLSDVMITHTAAPAPSADVQIQFYMMGCSHCVNFKYSDQYYCDINRESNKKSK